MCTPIDACQSVRRKLGQIQLDALTQAAPPEYAQTLHVSSRLASWLIHLVDLRCDFVVSPSGIAMRIVNYWNSWIWIHYEDAPVTALFGVCTAPHALLPARRFVALLSESKMSDASDSAGSAMAKGRRMFEACVHLRAAYDTHGICASCRQK